MYERVLWDSTKKLTHMGVRQNTPNGVLNERSGTEWMKARIKITAKIKRNIRQGKLSSMFNKRAR
jgi:hypothetical protein